MFRHFKQYLAGPRRIRFSLLILGVLMGVLFSSIFWNNKLLESQQTHSNYQKESQSYLENQIAVLRKESENLRHKGVLSNPLVYLKKENLSSSNLYTLDCSGKFDGIDKLLKKLESSESRQICFNKERDLVVILSTNPSLKTGEFNLQLYDIQADQLSPLTNEIKTNTYGCNKIVYWTKSDSIYYECTGLYQNGIVQLIRYNLRNQIDSLVQSCSSFTDQSGKRNTCVQYCESDNQCDTSMECNKLIQLCQYKSQPDGGYYY